MRRQKLQPRPRLHLEAAATELLREGARVVERGDAAEENHRLGQRARGEWRAVVLELIQLRHL